MFRGKKYQDSAKQIDKALQYDPKEGLELMAAHQDHAMPASASAQGTGKPCKRANPPISGAAASTRAIQTDKTRNHLPDASPSRSAPAPSAAQAIPQEKQASREEESSRPFMERARVCHSTRRAAAMHPAEEQNRRRRGHTSGPDHTAQAIPAAMRAKTGQTHQSKGISSSPLPFPAAMDAKPRTRQPCQHHAASRVHFPSVPFMRENRTGRAHP